MPAPLQVTSLAALKSFLTINQNDLQEDQALLNLITGCDQVVRTWLRITSWQPSTTYTEYVNGNNSEFIRLRQKPVLSLTAVYEDPTACAGQGANDFAAGTLLTPGVDYYLPWNMPDGSEASWTGQIQRLGTVWQGRWIYKIGLLTPSFRPSTGTIKVVYQAGWANGVPADIALAAQTMIARFRMSAQYGATLANTSYKGFSVGLSDHKGFFQQECKDLLATYRRLLS